MLCMWGRTSKRASSESSVQPTRVKRSSFVQIDNGVKWASVISDAMNVKLRRRMKLAYSNVVGIEEVMTSSIRW